MIGVERKRQIRLPPELSGSSAPEITEQNRTPCAMNADRFTPEIKPTDLRGILKYVPQWRNHCFVIALDGAIIHDDNFGNIVLDLAVLRSLNIRVVLVLGLGWQLTQLSQQRKVAITDARGEGPVDDATLRLSIEAASNVTHEVLQGLTAAGLKCAVSNAVRATEMGVLGGIPQMYRGKVDKIDLALIRHLMDGEIIPVHSAIAFCRDGRPLRVNSDLLASEMALALSASKLIYLTPHPGLTVKGVFQLNMPVGELSSLLQQHPEQIAAEVRSKAEQAIRTIAGGTPRVHIMDGRMGDGLLSEIFSKVGVGTMVYGNDYQQIRRARRKDVAAIFGITRHAVRTEALRGRSRQAIERDIDHFFVFEIDESVIGCVALFPQPDGTSAEIASVYVQSFYQHRGVGKKLVDFACREAKTSGVRWVFALTTQSYAFFRNVCGFEDASLDDLPAARLQMLRQSGRNSRVLKRQLEDFHQ